MRETILTNPITFSINQAFEDSIDKIFFAVPFLTNFALTVFNEAKTERVIDKKCIVRFDESNILSFDVPALKRLLDLGFEIRYDNNIHLKLYITDNDIYVSSSNFTKGGFESNIELTVKIDNDNYQKCLAIFNQLWDSTQE